MPAHLLTTVIVVEAKLNQGLIEVLQGYGSAGSTVCRELLRVLDCDNAKEEIDILKQIFKDIRHNCGISPHADDQVEYPLQFLVHLCFVSTSKNPARRVLESFLQTLPRNIQESMIHPFMREALLEMFKQPIRNKDDLNEPIMLEECANLRHDVNTMAALMDNFPLGEESVRSECIPALEYLTLLQTQFLLVFHGKLSPVQQNETMHHCLETVKLTNRILQKASADIEAKVKVAESLSWFQKIAGQLVDLDIRILKTADFLMDCKTTSAMNIALLLKTLAPRDTLVFVILQTFFPNTIPCDQIPSPDWLTDLNLSQLRKASLTSPAYLSLCYGIVAMLPMASLTFTLGDSKCLLLDVLLPEFLDLSKSCSDVGSKLLAAKAVCLLTQRVCQHLRACDGSLDPRLLARLHGEGEDMRTVLEFVWTSWEDSVDAIRFTMKDVFDNVVTGHLLAAKMGKQTEPETFLHTMAKSILTDVSWSCKGKYGTLSSLVGHIGSARMLELHAGIAADVLQQMQEQTLSCYASDLYDKLSTGHRTQVSSAAITSAGTPSTAVWQTTWVDPVLRVLCGDNNTQKKHVIEYIVPKLLKSDEGTLKYMISSLSTPSCMADPCGGLHAAHSNRLGALIICLRRARALGQLQHIPSKSERRKENSRRRREQLKKQTGNADCSTLDDISQSDSSANIVINQALATSGETGQSEISSETSDNTSQSNDIEGKCNQLVQSSQSVNTSDTADMTSQSNDRGEKSNQSVQTDQSDLWYGVVDRRVLQQALDSHDEQIRLDAFALLCENQKTTETICDLEVTLVRGFIPQNLNSQNPAYRQHFLSHLKKFVSRMKESGAVLRRAVVAKNDAISRDVLLAYKTFLSWLQLTLLSNLHPGSVFARRTTCLGGLVLLLYIYGTDGRLGNCLPGEFTFHDGIAPCDIHTLLHCLTDTFEDSKTDAARILIACSAVKGNILSDSEVSDLLDIAMTLSTSTRPQDSTTAAYMFRVLLRQSVLGKILNFRVTSLNIGQKEADNRTVNQSGETVNCGTSLDSVGEKTDVQSEKLPNHRKTSQHDDKNGGGEITSCKHEVAAETSDVGDIGRRRLLLLQLLLTSLQEQTTVAQSNLIMAAANSPLYPTMQCMRYCLVEVDFRQLPSDTINSWQTLLTRFIRLCLTIAEVVSPVVHNSSPEGNIPVEAIKGLAIETPMGEDVARSHETVMLMPEYLVVCCWRSIKEISLILGQLTSDVPLQGTRSLLTHQQILDIGGYFTTQLLESKHRGAFELAYAGFVKVTDMLWRSNIAELHRLPRQWLDDVMSDIVAGDPDSRLCATRRSAGVPFYVQALVTTEPPGSGKSCFKAIMQQLLTLAFSETSTTDSSHIAKVHALNILRAMYKDTRLADDVAPYIADGLKVAILGFKSPLWAVRNSATLLMSAMMTRIFGVKRSKDESSLSRKNCQTGRTFFYHYPSLYQFLLSLLQEASEGIGDPSPMLQQSVYIEERSTNSQQCGNTGESSTKSQESDNTIMASKNSQQSHNIGGLSAKCNESPDARGASMKFHLHPALYPVLMVLGRLFPSVLEGTDTSLSLGAFIPHIVRCSSSAVLKTRVMAARALQPLVERSQVTSVFTDLLTLLPQQPGEGVTQSSIHGVLLQIKQLLAMVPSLASSSQLEVQKVVVPAWTKRAHLLMSRSNPCLLTRKEALEVSARMATSFTQASSITSQLCGILMDEVTSMDTYDPCFPGLSEFLVTVCNLSFQFLPREINPSRSGLASPDTGFQGSMVHMEQKKSPKHVLHVLSNDLMESDEVENGGESSSIILRNLENQSENIKVLNQSDALVKSNQSDRADSNVTTEIEHPSHSDGFTKLTVERMILGFLNSSAYEVRKACLVTLRNILIHKVHQDGLQNKFARKHIENLDDSNLFENITETSAEFILPVLESSQDVYELLMTLALGAEGHHECMAEVFAVLQVHATCRQRRSLKSTKFPAPLVFDKLLKLINSYSRVDVCAAAIEYSGHFLGPMYSLIALEARGEYDYAQSQMACLREWALVLQRYSRAEESPDAQLACAWALLQNAQILLCDPQALFGPLIFTFWKILIDLLHVDDLEVKDVAASVVMEIGVETKAVPHAYLAVDVLIGQMLRIHGDSKMADCMTALIGWIVERDNEDDHQEERLFDKGEMNTYREEINVIQTLDKHLLHLVSSVLCKLPDDVNTSKSSRKKAHEISSRDSQEITCMSSPEDVIRLIEQINCRCIEDYSDSEFSTQILNFLAKCKEDIEEFKQLDYRSAYLKTSIYSKNLTELYRLLTLLKYGLLLPVSDACWVKVVEVIGQIQAATGNLSFCRLLSDTFSAVKLSQTRTLRGGAK